MATGRKSLRRYDEDRKKITPFRGQVNKCVRSTETDKKKKVVEFSDEIFLIFFSLPLSHFIEFSLKLCYDFRHSPDIARGLEC